MKIAVQISGQLRSIQQSFWSLKSQILDHFDCDLFLSTWGRAEDHQEVIDLIKPTGYTFEEFSRDNLDALGINRIVDKYKLSTLVNFYGLHKPANQRNAICFLYVKWKCNQIRQQSKIKYDVIINTRTDLVYGERLNPVYVEAAQDRLLIPAGHNWDGGVNDTFSIASPDVMDTLCDQFVEYEQYMNEYEINHPEYALRLHIMKHQLPLARFSYVIYLRERQLT